MIDFEKYKTLRKINIFSNALAEIIICECGIRTLLELKRMPNKHDESKFIRCYTFDNLPIVYETFCKYADSVKDE